MNPEDHTVIVSKAYTGVSPAESTSSSSAETAASASGHLPKGTKIEGFEITELLGIGGFGLVYKAWDPTLEREVALKEYLPESLAFRDAHGLVRLKKESHKETFDAGMRSFVNEAKLLARFDHPALIKVFRFWESHGTAYMVMPYYKGKTLKALQAETQAPTSPEYLLNMILPMCDALHIMHQQHCIHRDVSPDNVIVEESSGKPILLDFGAARRAIGQCGQSFTVILKSGYAPIEQYAEIPHYQQGPWTDVYALAALAHYLIRGKAPSPAVGRMVHDSHQSLANDASLPYEKHLLHALDWGLQIEPDKRPQSMLDFRAALMGTLSPDEFTTQGSSNASLIDDFLGDKGTDLDGNHSDEAQSSKRSPLRLTPTQWMQWTGLALIPVFCLLYFLLATQPSATPETQANKLVNNPTTHEADHDTPAPQGEIVANDVEALPDQIRTDTAPRTPNDIFSHIVSSATKNWNLKVESPLQQLRIDKDLLRLNLSSNRDGYLTIWVESVNGNMEALPTGGISKSRRIQAGQKVQIPDISEPLLASGPPGKNRILVLITPKALDRQTVAYPQQFDVSQMEFGAGMVEIEQVTP